MKHKVNIKGVIISNDEEWIYDLFDIAATSPRKVAEALEEAAGKDIEVIINSGGGSVYDASEIYTDLRSYPGNVETRIVALAASAASVIAMAGDKVTMAPTGQMMIHNASVMAYGDHHDMNKTAGFLQNVNKTIANAYKMKSGLDDSQLLQMMDDETWLTPQQALEYNLIDEIMFEDNQIKLSASASSFVEIPQAVINGIKKGVLNKQASQGYVKEDTLKQMFEEFKNEIKNEIKSQKEPTPEPVEPKQNLSKLFLNF